MNQSKAILNNEDMQGFGPHLMLDCSQCNLDKISDVAYVFDVLNRLPDFIGMTKITQPYVFPYSGLVPEDKGVTGVVIIAESHLSFHSFIEKDYFFFDLFSCKPFDVELARQFIMEAFEVQKAETHYVERGMDFPRSETPAKWGSPEAKQAVPLFRKTAVPVGV
jgi:S-adenosylmethionine decarboxylase